MAIKLVYCSERTINVYLINNHPTIFVCSKYDYEQGLIDSKGVTFAENAEKLNYFYYWPGGQWIEVPEEKLTGLLGYKYVIAHPNEIVIN